MEDLKTYIESGILELYVLDEISPAERLKVEKMVIQYPEVKAELNEIEHALIQYSQSHNINPADDMRNRILNSLETVVEKEVPVKSINASVTPSKFYKYAFAASVALLVLSIAALINLSTKLNESNSQIAVLQSSNQKFSSRVNYIDKELQNANTALNVYQNPSEYKLIKLKGTDKAPQASMLVAFNSQKEEVMIDLSSLKMPANDSSHQYQLWAMIDGKPVDLGVFDSSSDNTAGMKKMKSVKNAQAFAVTLEPKGGSISPTLEQLMVIGNT
ncbi:MAG: anti-sigma factor [Daejeonella sp.]